jgi:hypothetical protein
MLDVCDGAAPKISASQGQHSSSLPPLVSHTTTCPTPKHPTFLTALQYHQLSPKNPKLGPCLQPTFKSTQPPDPILFTATRGKPFDGILSYLRHHQKLDIYDAGIVIPEETCRSEGLWRRWDFRQMRVHLTHYSIKPEDEMSWLLQSSMDGVNWTELDERHHSEPNQELQFAVSMPMECRFIRLTRTDHGRRRLPNWDLDLDSGAKRRWREVFPPDTNDDVYFEWMEFMAETNLRSINRHYFSMIAVEFFGTLSG